MPNSVVTTTNVAGFEVTANSSYPSSSGFYCHRCVRNWFIINNDNTPEGRYLETVLREYGEGIVITPTEYIEGEESICNCVYCGQSVPVSGSLPMRQWHPVYGYDPVRTCVRCTREFAQTRANFYTVAGNWSNNCRNCCDQIRMEAIRSGRRRVKRRIRQLTSPRRFGVEIEFVNSSRQQVSDALNNTGINCQVRSYGHEVPRTMWKVIGDGSLPGDASNCGELVSPPMNGDSGFTTIQTVSTALRSAGAQTNNYTGLHVHHDATDLDAWSFARVFRFYKTHQKEIDKLFVQGRRVSGDSNGTQYAEAITSSYIESVENLVTLNRQALRQRTSRFGRYTVLNLSSYSKYGTLEFRQHHGSTDSAEIIPWIEFGQALLNWGNSDVAPLPDRSGLSSIVRTLSGYGLESASADALLQVAIDRRR